MSNRGVGQDRICLRQGNRGTEESNRGRSFSHRAHRVNRAFLRTVSSPQNASGIQSSQSVTANVGTNKGQQVAYILLIGVSR